MTTERDSTPIVKAWLKGTADSPYETSQTASEIMTRLPEVRQRGRWWPLPSFERTPTSTKSIPATQGHAPTVTGRTTPMFSPVKAITAGALVFAIGGFLLIAQPFEEQSASVPGAATDDASVAMSRFTVLERDDGFRGGWGLGPVSVTDEGLLLEEGSVQFGFIYTTDPRINGDYVHTYNGLLVDEETGSGETGISVHTMIVENAGGRWIGTGTQILGRYWTMVLEGVDGYEGLTAVWVAGPEDERAGVGVISPGAMPPTPKDWCQVAREDLAAARSRILDDEISEVKDRTRRLCPSVEMP